MKVSQLLVKSLEAYGVERAYGLVGTSILDLMDALYASKIRYVSTRHEQVAVSMADADGRVTGKPGVAFVHGGPGFLNSLVSVTNAWKDGSPLLLVAGAVKRRMVGMDSWLEVPQSEMVRSVVKRAWRVEKGSDAAGAISGAYALSASPPFGPTFVEVPEDVWGQDGGNVVPRLMAGQTKNPAKEDIGTVAAAMGRAARPLIVVGGGMNSPEGAESLKALMDKIGAPAVTTGNGRGAIAEDEPLALGRIGFGGGNNVADSALAQADVVLCLGCGLSDVSTYGFNLTPRGDVFVVDMDPLWDRKPIPCAMHAECDAPSFTKALAAQVVSRGLNQEWKSTIDESQKGWAVLLSESKSRTKPGFVNASRFLQSVDTKLQRDAVIAVGQGLHVLYAYAFVRVRSNRSFLAATNMGSMGFVFPAALGAKMAYPTREVVGVMGDGEFLMTVQDLETAVREKIGVKLIVVNDNSYRVLLMRQKIQKMGRIFGTTHSNPDIVKLAESFGAKGVTVSSDSEIDEATEFIMEPSETPRIVNLEVDPEDLPPLNIQGSLMF